MGLPIFEFLINPEDETLGMKAISLVDSPAIESQYIAFNKEAKQTIFKFQDDKKYIVAGLALIPDKLIYRVDEESGQEYYGYFSEETIEIIMDKFMKESVNGTLHNVNLQHNADNKVQAHLIESYILRNEEIVNAVKAMGIEDAVLGAWFVAYKFDNKEDYDNAVNGGFKGFSIEIMLQRELKLHKNNIKNNNKIMTKVKEFIDKFKTILTEMENNLEDVAVPETGKSLRIGEIGQPVLWVSIDEAGEEVTEPALEGEYILEDGRIVVVDAQGNLAEIKEEAVAPIPEEEMAKEEKPEEKPVEEKAEEVVPEVPAEETPIADVTAKTLGEIVDVSKDGEYVIKVVVAGGAVTEATVEAAQDLIQKSEFEAREIEITTLKEEVESLKAQLAKPVTKPAFVEYNEYKPKEDLSKLNNLQRTLKKLNLDK